MNKHCCAGLAKNGSYIALVEQNWLGVNRKDKVWCIFNANNVRELENVKYCPYCGLKVEDV